MKDLFGCRGTADPLSTHRKGANRTLAGGHLTSRRTDHIRLSGGVDFTATGRDDAGAKWLPIQYRHAVRGDPRPGFAPESIGNSKIMKNWLIGLILAGVAVFMYVSIFLKLTPTGGG